MPQRPKYLYFMSAAFVLLALAMPVQVMVIYGHRWYEAGSAMQKLTALNWLIVFLLLSCAGGLWKAAPFLRYAVPLLIAAVVFNNFWVGYYATDFSMWETTGASFGFLVLNLPLLRPEIAHLLRHPERRWWVRAQRRRIVLPVFIEGTRLTTLKAETFDLSETGVFIPRVDSVGVGDWITVRIGFGALNHLRCQARVARRSEARGVYPAGVGVQFMDLSLRQRRDLRRHLARQAAEPQP